MDELLAKDAVSGLVPLSLGGWTLSAVDPGPIWLIAPYPDQEAALIAAMERDDVGWPAPGNSDLRDTGRVIWAGRDQAMLMGRAPEAGWESYAAITDVSDGWCVLRLSGADAEDVLARLVPVDLRMSKFPEGAVARSLCGHMTVSITRVKAAFEIMAFRSMAGTLVHELETAMASLAARRGSD